MIIHVTQNLIYVDDDDNDNNNNKYNTEFNLCR